MNTPRTSMDSQGGKSSGQRPSINSERLHRDFDALAEIGSTGDGGVHRPSLTQDHLAARAWWKKRIEDDGLTPESDSAGNLSVRLECRDPDAQTLLLGSHLDSVPNGGRFDGALGVLAAYEVLRTVRDVGRALPFHLEAIDFTDEEGTLVGLLGSRALAGTLPADELASPRGGREALLQGYARAGLTDAGMLSAQRAPKSLAGFLEVHIEQGPRLVSAGIDIGIVTSMVGMGSAEIVFRGRADHSGTTPMGERRDAGLAAAETLIHGTALVTDAFPDCTVNFGKLDLQPGAYNIVPETATLMVEYRAGDDSTMARLEVALLDLARRTARKVDVDLDIRPRGLIAPSPCAPTIRQAFAAACQQQGLSSMDLTSGAGHDTMALAAVCPSGMIFIPSTGGSHSPREFAEREACANGANTLLGAVLELGEGC